MRIVRMRCIMFPSEILEMMMSKAIFASNSWLLVQMCSLLESPGHLQLSQQYVQGILEKGTASELEPRFCLQ